MNREQKKRFAILVAWIAGFAGLYLGSVAFASGVGLSGGDQWVAGVVFTLVAILVLGALYVLGAAAYVWIRDGYLG